MINHVWGLIHHPEQEWRTINKEHESVSHLYMHHVLLLAAIPVVSTFIGTTQFGWTFGGNDTIKVSMLNGLSLGVLFYLLILAAVAVVGSLIHRMAKQYPSRPSRHECIVFAGYIATPLFLSGIFAVYPIIWLCTLACVVGICYTAYLLYKGTPSFLGISHKEGFILSSSTLGIGILVLEAVLAGIVLLWSMGSEHSVVWYFFR
ncbi:Inner membrane protein YohC [Marinomonas spartinae]|uniref:Inner membrane protein YohC n=1 Tax=Marinomonas spartinae TaxID=1792290 RepID=A0A1A8TTQ2_9GAMM|nr:Yip1 family protein [Marinomonas spartinae]SBS31498.1 Inner membrane protein YohC [Marinomonas spartinae]SBS37864.1 Inner membrane protein YohC [Marinomonas spartinae]